MSLYINTNTSSLIAQQNLSKSQSALQSSIARLSSGMRIDTARDPQADLSIVKALPNQVKGLASVEQNRNDAISLAQTAEGGLSATSDVLQRMQQLTVQSLSNTMTEGDRDSLGEDFSVLRSEALKIAASTAYNGENLLVSGSAGPKTITSGTAQLDQSAVALISNGNPDDGILTRSYEGISLASSETFDISGASSVEQRLSVLKALDQMISDVSTARYAVGAFQNEAFSPVALTSANTDAGLYTPAINRLPDLIKNDFEADSARILARMQTGPAVLSQATNFTPSAAASLWL